ncbi:DUF1906 domain-containing protein [Kitasatospora sp. NPDC052896]|uniref:DUF1906 domain-containing protein n=1 Tax=Kitasatospora sp. NPDC052896 TaxID=3364061 RepID=UPI0037CB084D
MVRYLRPVLLSAAALTLLFATTGTAAGNAPLAPARSGAASKHDPKSASGHHPGPAPGHDPKHRPHQPDGAGRDRHGTDYLPYSVYTGAGFDACSAPPLAAMKAWHGTSPYGAVGIYISGRQRGCDQPLLTAAWVSQVRAQGWRLIPTHVGRQAPCADVPGKPQRIDPAHAVEQGREEAAEAVLGAQALGLGQGTPVYLDMESYASGDAACSRAVVDFTVGWTAGLHDAGYWSGYYSSVDSGICDLATAQRTGVQPLPDAVWYARWDGRAVTDGGGVLGDGQWTAHQRMHQYHGSADETYGGVTLTVDGDQLDTVVAP